MSSDWVVWMVFCQEPLFLEAADSLCGKLAVCDPVSLSKAAWATGHGWLWQWGRSSCKP